MPLDSLSYFLSGISLSNKLEVQPRNHISQYLWMNEFLQIKTMCILSALLCLKVFLNRMSLDPDVITRNYTYVSFRFSASCYVCENITYWRVYYTLLKVCTNRKCSYSRAEVKVDQLEASLATIHVREETTLLFNLMSHLITNLGSIIIHLWYLFVLLFEIYNLLLMGTYGSYNPNRIRNYAMING